MSGRSAGLPIPDLEPRSITLEEYHEYAAEKMELWEGYLFDPQSPSEIRRRFLALLLVNVGLLEAVSLAPEKRWREALDRVYGASTR